MIRCNKCNIEKEDNNFQKYWHSTQNRHRTRKQCTECFYNQRNERKRLRRKEANLNKVSISTEIIQPVVPELEPEVFIYTSDYKQCIGCKEYKTKDNFYKFGTDARFNRCKACIKKKDDEEREKELEEQGGSLQISPKPNTYKDKYQKRLVFEFLPLCGWKFNEEKGIWCKEGIKDENGKFLNLKKPQHHKYYKLKKEDHEEIIKLKEMGLTQKNIAERMNVSQAAICEYLKKVKTSER